MPGRTTIATSSKSSNDSLRDHDFSQRLPVVPSAAADRQNDPAMVRRIGRRVGRGDVVLPACAAGRVRLFARGDSIPATEDTVVRACGVAGAELRFAAHPAVTFMETI